MRSITRVALAIGVGGAVAAAAHGQLALPCFSTFDADTVGMLPTMGVPNSPTGLSTSLGTEADPTVVASSLGITTQPVEFDVHPDPLSSAMLVYDFDPNVTTVLRAEATVSVSALADMIVMRTWKNSTGLILGDINFNDSGEIHGRGGQLGTYTPGVPVRIRMDVNILNGRYAAIVDDELNGFADDTWVTGLTFANDPSLVDNCGGVGVGYNWVATSGFEMTVAVEDVLIMEIPAPGAMGLAMVAAAVIWWRRR